MSDTYTAEKRNNVIDYMKAVAIILMVLRHAGAPKTEIVEIFHMALFFMVSGWCFSDKYTSDIKMVGKFILRKVQTLYIPFVVFNLFNVWTHNILLSLNIYTDNPEFVNNNPYGGNMYGLFPYKDLSSVLWTTKEVLLFRGEYQLGGAAWFIRVLFWVSILWCIINYLIKKITKNNQAIFAFHLCIASILLMFSYYCSMNHITYKEGFETVSAAYSMLFLGYYLKRSIPAITTAKNALFMFIISFILLECLFKFCGILNWNSKINDYGEPLLLLMTSTAGFFVIYAVSLWIDLKFSCKWLLIVGRNTMSIVLLHFLAFKFVNMIYVMSHNLPNYLIAAFPVLYPKWWLLYGIVGVGLPVCLSLLYQRGKVVIRRNRIYQILAMSLVVCFCSLVVGYNIINKDNIGLRHYDDYGYEWRDGHYDDGWLSDKSRIAVYNKRNETKYLILEYYTLSELDGVEVTVCDKSETVIYSDKLHEGNGIIRLPIEGENIYSFAFSDSYNPAKEGMNEDMRDLTILIVSASVSDN